MLSLTAAVSCKKDDDDPANPPDENESELITTIKMMFTDSAEVLPDTTFVFRDIDGIGGNPPSRFDTIHLSAGNTFWVQILLLDESKVPTDTISVEVLEEAEDHQFFFIHTGVDITTTYRDSDSNGLPLGLSTRWVSGAPGAGTSTIILKHQPGVKDGTMVPGETDVELEFQSIVN